MHYLQIVKFQHSSEKVLQQQHPIESIQNVKLPLYTNFCDDKFQSAAFSSLISRKSAAVAVLKLQQNSIEAIRSPMLPL